MDLVLLAGGKSRRMKRNKLFLPFDQEETLMAYMLHRLTNYFQTICIVTNEEYRQRIQKIVNLSRYFSVSVVTDIITSCGPLVGIYTGLNSIPSSSAFFLAADQPFVSLPLIHYMFTKIDCFDAVVPRTDKGFEPLFCIYTKQCIHSIKTMIDSEIYQVSKLFDRINTAEIQTEEIKRYDPGMQSFINVNTESDYRLLNPTFNP
jgi:molybdopterin-guanine dinucleotide biosynthesis protein A